MTDLFLQATKAELPLIGVDTTDLINLDTVLNFMAGGYGYRRVLKGTIAEVEKLPPETVRWIAVVGDPAHTYEQLYPVLKERGQSLIVVNPEERRDSLFYVGSLLPPKPLVRSLLSDLVAPEGLDEALSAFSGLTLKEAEDILRLAPSMAHSDLLNTRARVMPKATGLDQVSTESTFYQPYKAVSQWLDENGTFFLTPVHEVLRPRGVLMTGEPGTGKTSGAKYIARTFGVPLYRLDLSSMMTKWQGEAEGNLSSALAQADQEAPCVLLLDEVDKLFGGSGESDSGTTSRLLSKLLWWLQEHQSVVFTIMTTNDLSVLPPELYRPGRMDTVLTIEGLRYTEASLFIERILESIPYTLNKQQQMAIASLLWMKLDKVSERVPHARIVQAVYSAVKKDLRKK